MSEPLELGELDRIPVDPRDARVAELEADLERMTAARNRDHQQALANGVAAATEREQRKAAEALLLWLAMWGKWGNEERDAVAAHFARYEKAPT